MSSEIPTGLKRKRQRTGRCQSILKREAMHCHRRNVVRDLCTFGYLGMFGMLGTFQNRQHAVVARWATTIFWWACALAFDAGKGVVTFRNVLDLDFVLPTITRVVPVDKVKPLLGHRTDWGWPLVNHQYAHSLIRGSALDLVDLEIVQVGVLRGQGNQSLFRSLGSTG
jgi:hypothetical protein